MRTSVSCQRKNKMKPTIKLCPECFEEVENGGIILETGVTPIKVETIEECEL